MRCVLELYDTPPDDGRVVCADEFVPLNLQPRADHAWRPTGHPVRLRATYNRRGRVRHMLGALDLTSGEMISRIRARRRSGEFVLVLPQALRARWPREKLYLICDNFSPHKRPDVA